MYFAREKALGDVVLSYAALYVAAHKGLEVGLVTAARMARLFEGGMLPVVTTSSLGGPVVHRLDNVRPPMDWWRRYRRVPLVSDATHQLQQHLLRISDVAGVALDASALPAGPWLPYSAWKSTEDVGHVIGLAPGSQWPLKRIRPTFLATLLNALRERFPGATLRALGTHEDWERYPKVQVEKGFLGGDLLDLRNSVGTCSVVIGADSGPLHLAQLLDIPSFGLFGPTSFTRWGPWRDSGSGTVANLPCQPCSSHGQRPCRFTQPFCHDLHSVSLVQEWVQKELYHVV